VGYGFTSRLCKSTHSSGAKRPRTPPWSIHPISPVLPPLKFDGADRSGKCADRPVNGADRP